MKLLSGPHRNAKIAKSNNKTAKYLGDIMHLAPYKLSGYQVCSSASAGCIAACLNTSSFHQKLDSTQNARINRTKMFFEDRAAFETKLRKEIDALVRKGKREGKKIAVRLNGTSDLQWETLLPTLFTDYPDIQWYDYTKHFNRMMKYCNGELPSNYHLTFSKSENNAEKCEKVLTAGGNVAIVFSGKELPEYYEGYPVVDGDASDFRFLDDDNVIVGLAAKGDAKTDDTGFAISLVELTV